MGNRAAWTLAKVGDTFGQGDAHYCNKIRNRV